MKLQAEINEDKVFSAFLEAELFNPRHADKFDRTRHLLQPAVLVEDVIRLPNYAELRRELVQKGRGWPDKWLFYGFPVEVQWSEIEFDTSDLEDTQYINYSYWNELSGGSRSPVDAALAIKLGREVFGQTNDTFYAVAEQAKLDAYFPPIVLVKDPEHPELTVLEGHVRLTGFAVAGHIPKEQQFYIGIGKDMKQWSDHDKS